MLLCNAGDLYRSIDGSCNNLQNPWRGAAKTPLARLSPSTYQDGKLNNNTTSKPILKSSHYYCVYWAPSILPVINVQFFGKTNNNSASRAFKLSLTK